MKVMDGSYLEDWKKTNNTLYPLQLKSADAIAMTIQLMQEAYSKDKLVTIRTESEDDFELGVFLLSLEEHGYILAQDAVVTTTNETWDVSDLEIYNKCLGEPLGKATKCGYNYSRSFEYLDVSVNLYTRETEFIWKDCELSTAENDSTEISFSIFPNPTSDLVQFSEKANYQVSNLLGQEVLSGEGASVDLSDQPQGIYLLRVEEQVFKIIKK